MAILKYKNVQLSIFDFEKETSDRANFISKIDEALNLTSPQSPKVIIESLLTRPEAFTYQQRLFIKQMIISHVDKRTITDKQLGYLQSLYSKINQAT